MSGLKFENPYDACRQIKRYHEKNGYAPTCQMVNISVEYAERLVKNGVVELVALHEGGPKIYLVLTDKGCQMSDREPLRKLVKR